MLTLRVACFITVLSAVASSEETPPNTALEWQPVKWFVVYLSSALLLLLVMVTCATRREHLDSKGLLGVDLVERGVLQGEQSGGLFEWLARRWPWSPAPRRRPQLSHLRMGLARSAQPLLSYQLVEKRHVHLARGALCVIRTDLEELQELAEKENLSRGSTDSGDTPRKTSLDSQRGSGSGSLTERFGSVTGNPIVQLGTVNPVETKSQPLFRRVKPLGTSEHRVSWSPSLLNLPSDSESLEEGEVVEPLNEDIPTDSVVITGDSTQRHNQISETDFALDANHTEKWGTLGETTGLSETAETGGRDESQTRITITEKITQAGDHVTPPKSIMKVRSLFDVHREGGRKYEPTIPYEDTKATRDLLPQHKMKSASDLEQSSESDVLDEISDSSDDLPPYIPLHKESQEQDFMLDDNTELDSELETFRYTSKRTGDPESSPSQEEVLTAIDKTVIKYPNVYMSVLDHDASKLPEHTLPKEEREDSDASACVSSCFLHPVGPQSQQEFNKRNSSKSVQYTSLPPEKENSAQQLQYWQQSEYHVAPASVTTTNNTGFSARQTPTKWQRAKTSEKCIAAEEVPRLPTSWDLLHSFPCHTDTVQMLRLDTTSKMNSVSNYSGLKQHDEHSLYQRGKGGVELATKQQKSCNMERIISDNRHMCTRAERHTSTVWQPPSSFRTAYTPVSYSETDKEQQRHPLNAGEHHKVLQWRITISPHLTRRSKGNT